MVTDAQPLKRPVQGWLQGPYVSAVLLVLANLLPVAGVLFAGWDVGTIVLFFWAENLAIGFFNVIRLLTHPEPGSTFSALFFLVHYGGFTAGHGFFIYHLFNLQDQLPAASTTTPWSTPAPAAPLTDIAQAVVQNLPQLWLWGLLALFVSHGASLLLNDFARGERHRRSLKALMSGPYRRIMVLHVTIIIGGIVVDALGSPIYMLLMLVALKTAIDLRSHWRGHRIPQTETPRPLSRESGN